MNDLIFTARWNDAHGDLDIVSKNFPHNTRVLGRDCILQMPLTDVSNNAAVLAASKLIAQLRANGATSAAVVWVNEEEKSA